ncbi:MAG TPA: hypothetical protein VK586_05195 [Streptosporangiaceae bacterium]|nr:hypothetical protein [Streptosporangiaceae bacterium]
MRPGTKVAVGAGVLAIILFIFLPWYIPAALLALAIGVPVVGWAMLSSSQRSRIRSNRRRSIGS